MKKYFLRLKNNWPLFVVLAIAFLARFYRLRELTTFGGDQGVDYLRVFEMLESRRPTLLGPVTHVGVYLGPLYYYMLVPFFLIFRFDPIAAPVMFALFGTVTAGLVFILAKNLLRFNLAAARLNLLAFLTAALYAVSPVILESSRAPSQPHLIPFFATLLLISAVRIIEGRAGKWDLAAIGITLSATIQFHFLAFPLWIFTLIIVVYKGPTLAYAKVGPLLVPMAILLFPWFLFELRHNFFISHQIFSYLRFGEVGFSPVAYLERVLDLTWFSFDRLVGQGNQLVTTMTIVASLSAVLGIIKVRPRSAGSDLLILLAAFFVINIFGISLYSFPLSNHYISALYPVVIILTAYGIFQTIPRILGFIIFITIIIFILGKNNFFRNHGYTMSSGVTIETIEKAAAVIADDMKDKNMTFEIANTLDGDTRAHPYRYVLTAVYKLKPLGVEKYPEADRLYIVSREPGKKLLEDKRWELLSFPVVEVGKLAEVSPGISITRFTAGTADRQELIMKL